MPSSAKGSAPHLPEAIASPNTEEVRALTERILHSQSFQRSPRLLNFLTFVTKCALEDRAHEVNEYSVGVQVFGKPADYNPNEDNIVRVSARQLRTKLSEYYTTEGRAEAWILEIPKGGYLPSFRSATCEGARVEAHHPPPLPRKWSAAVIPLALLALGSLALNGWLLTLGWRQQQRPAPCLLSRVLRDLAVTTTVVVSDPSIAVAANWSGNQIDVEEYLQNRHLDSPAFSDSKGKLLRSFIEGLYVTAIPDVHVVSRLYRVASEVGREIEVRHCKNLRVRDLDKGNYIILGGPGANPWVSLLQKGLNFEQYLRPGQGRGFRNRAPRANEPAFFETSDAGDSKKTYYARIAVTKNPLGSGRVALIGGTSGLSTEAAGEYALSLRGLDRLKQLCGIDDVDKLSGFELVLETSALGGAPVEARVVAHRCRVQQVDSPK